MYFSIANQFSKTPGLRLREQSNFSGQEFRENHLRKLYHDAVEKNETIIINLDGTYGYPYSFISEAFGGLAREVKDVSRSELVGRFIFISNDQPSLVERIIEVMMSEVE